MKSPQHLQLYHNPRAAVLPEVWIKNGASLCGFQRLDGCCDEHHEEEQLGEGSVFSGYRFQSITKGSQTTSYSSRTGT